MDVFKNKNKLLVSPVTFPGTWSWIWSWKTYKCIASTIYLNSKLEKIKCQYTHNSGQQKFAESNSIVQTPPFLKRGKWILNTSPRRRGIWKIKKRGWKYGAGAGLLKRGRRATFLISFFQALSFLYLEITFYLK